MVVVVVEGCGYVGLVAGGVTQWDVAHIRTMLMNYEATCELSPWEFDMVMQVVVPQPLVFRKCRYQMCVKYTCS